MELLTVKQLMQLMNCSHQHINKEILAGRIKAESSVNSNGRKIYLIPLEDLEPKLQIKWYRQQGQDLPEKLRKAARKELRQPAGEKPLEQFSAVQREEIAKWIDILEDWQRERAQAPSKAEGDRAFCAASAARYGRRLTPDILYRHWNAYRYRDWDGLVDKRGLARKGISETPKEIRDLFEWCYLDEHAPSIQKCKEAVELVVLRELPELKQQLPAYDTYRRWAKALSKPVAVYAREGETAYYDRWEPSVDRLYDDMEPNEYWIADGHRIDVITRSEDGREKLRRLTISAIIDAYSGIYVGWCITDNPSSDATLYALRKAILKYGLPRYLYVDNGREYLTADIGGLGHRTKARKVEIKLPTPILQRLGITMVNALPRNGRAKIIEREFRNFTFLSQLFDTYCGSNVVTKPDKLKHMLKAGRIPTDGHLCQVVEDMIEGYFNLLPYNGKIVENRGIPKLDAYLENLHSVRKASPEDLTLLLMRSTRLQKVGKNGVYVQVGGQKIYYSSDELVLQHAEQRVFVRYDPEKMGEVRVYDENEVYLLTAPMSRDMMLPYGASKEEIGASVSRQRRRKKLVKQAAAAKRELITARFGEINLLDLWVSAAREAREGRLETPAGNVIELVTAPDRRQMAATGTDPDVRPVEIDIMRMIRSNERRSEE